MQTSSKPLRQEKEEKIIRQLATLIADVSSPNDAEQLLRDFLTPTELSVLAKRLAIFQMLKNDSSYQEIQTELKVSSATISSVAEFRSSRAASLVEAKLNADEWAQRLAQKIWDALPQVLKKRGS